MKVVACALFLLSALVCVRTAIANDVWIVDVTYSNAGSTYTFNVTLEHKDQGREHYANLWEVWTADGRTLLGKRALAHPHVDEQPFTRSLSGVEVPDGATEVLIRAYDLMHGLSPHTYLVNLSGGSQ